jgi:small-conductance mechanosensitive channel
MRRMKEFFASFEGTTFLGNKPGDWLVAGIVFVAIFLVVEFIRGMVRSRLQRLQHNARPSLQLLGRLAKATSRTVVLSVALYSAEKWLELPPNADRLFEVIIVAGIAVQLALWAAAALRFAIEHHYRGTGNEPGASPAIGVLMFVGQLVIWTVFVLLGLDNLGVNITALVAGLGVGGIAIALAVQTLLGDLLGSMSIAMDKPFAVGDALRIDDIEGTVEHVGIKSTRLRAVTGEQVIFSNADILKSRVRNLGRMPERRVLFRLMVAYENKPAQIEQVAAIVKRVVEGQQGTRFVQCLLASLGADALEFEVVYFVANSPKINHGATVDAINRGIVREFSGAGISFAYPARRLLVQQASPAAPAAQ